MILLANKSDVCTFKDPLKPGAHAHKWWAQGGLVCWQDTVTGDDGAITVRDALLRIKAISDMVGNSRRGASRTMAVSALEAFQEYIDSMVEVCKKAQRQGMPDDPDHSRQLVADLKERRRSTVVVPSPLPSF